MNRILLILFLTFSLTGFSQTQSEMNKTAHSDFKKVESELYKTYQEILIEYKENKIFIRNLKSSQRIWLKYRKAELKLKFPKQASEMYGSSFLLCRTFLLTKITNKRIEFLNTFLVKPEDGDICN